MPVQYWESVLNAGSPYQTTNGTVLTTSLAATDVSPAPQLTLPANFYYTGQVFRARAWGIYSTTATPTLTIGFYYGGVAGTALAATTTTTTGSGVSNLMWHAEATMRVVSLGATGTINAFGLCHGIAATASTPVLMPTTSATGNLVTVNTTTANAWTCGATFSASSSLNTLTCYFFMLELLT